MLIIKHRVNRIKQLKQIPKEFGVEIDLRSNNNSIYLNHDPYKYGTKFEKWIKFFKHQLIVLNVKEEGLEKKIIKILKKNNIKSFFFHDQTFSSMLTSMKRTKTSIRYSEFEEIKRKEYIFKYIKWLWIDHFTQFTLDGNFYKFLKKNKVKICLVSPELVNKKTAHQSIIKIKKILLKKNFTIDAVCTKTPSRWSTLFSK
jgi:hypothetical protein